MPDKRHFIHIWLYRALALALLALLAACGGPTRPTALPQSDNGYLLTVPIAASDTPERLAQRYGGEVIAWLGEQAILKLSSQAAAALQGSGVSLQNATLEPNTSVSAPVNAHGFNSWAGGWNSWAGGWNSWAGGWNSWAGGSSTIPTLPSENRHAWHRIALPQAFAISKNFGAGMKVAVIDTGIDLNHPMFQGRLAPSSEWRDFVDGDNIPQEVAGGSAYGHGTAVAGLILQVAPRAKILPIRVLNPNGTADVATVAQAINWAVAMNARILNLSLGTNVDVTALKTAIDYATSMAIFVVASAGNEGSPSSITFPAAYATTGANARYLLSVGSAQHDATLSAFSNRSAALEVAAPGELLYSAFPDNRVASVTGTSFAAPLVSGALALAAYETNIAHTWNLESFLVNSAWNMSTGGRHISLNFMYQWFPDFQRWRKALFVVGSTNLNSGDMAVLDRLHGYMNYAVTVKTGASVTSADANGMDVVVISSTVNPNDVNTKFRNEAVPVVTWEAQLFDDMGMVPTTSGSLGTATGQTSVVIHDNTHPLGAGILLGNTAQYGAGYPVGVTMSWGKPNANAIRIATLPSDSTRAAIFAYDRGVAMVGLTAPARRVAFMFHDASPTTLSQSWWTAWLFDAAVTWAVTGN